MPDTIFKNISGLKRAFGIEAFTESRLSRKGNWVVSGEGSTTHYSDVYFGAGTVEYYSVTAVYKNDETGTLIDWSYELVDDYTF